MNTVRVHIDQRPFNCYNPTTGADLYALGHVAPDLALFKEVRGNREDRPVPNDGSQRTRVQTDQGDDDDDTEPDTVIKASTGNGDKPGRFPDLTSALATDVRDSLLDIQQEIRHGLGSNNWVVNGAHTATGKPLLANDTHLELNLPPIWYEVHVTAPGWNVKGFTLPGAPPT